MIFRNYPYMSLEVAANVNDVTQAQALLHGDEKSASAMPEIKGQAAGSPKARCSWNIALRPGKRRALDMNEIDQLRDQLEAVKARIRAKVERIRSTSSRTG